MAAQACTLREGRKYVDGCDEDQRELLKSRKTKKGCTTEVDYWKEVYKILFPDVGELQIPSACKTRTT
jgi:hypothetical protein